MPMSAQSMNALLMSALRLSARHMSALSMSTQPIYTYIHTYTLACVANVNLFGQSNNDA